MKGRRLSWKSVPATDSDNMDAGTLSAHFVTICLVTKQIVRTQEHESPFKRQIHGLQQAYFQIILQ